MVSGVGVLIFVLYVPGGLMQILDQLRLGALRRLARRAGVATEDSLAQPAVDLRAVLPKTTQDAAEPRRDSSPILTAQDVVVAYGHVRALDGMSIEVRAGETLGIIGPNGSGKTTLFKVLAGFLRPRDGRITLAGRDVSRLVPEARARLGLIRSFQDSLLFPTLTVVDSVKLAHELRIRTMITSSVLGLPNARRSERRRAESAMEMIELLGLTSFRQTLVGELSTGTRRITELCCLLALEPRVLLLDEPSSGIAQSETDALRDLLTAVKARLGTTLVVIEHDMPLISSISDRIVAMASGRTIAEGTPSEVQSDHRVVESYLGTTAAAIGRSGPG
jgi:ABC-type branched-subunit amino acid transport system ATPase component